MTAVQAACGKRRADNASVDTVSWGPEGGLAF